MRTNIDWQVTFNKALYNYKNNCSQIEQNKLANIVSIDISKSIYENFKDAPDLAGGFIGYVINMLLDLENVDKDGIISLLRDSYMTNTPIDINKLNSYIGNPISLAKNKS